MFLVKINREKPQLFAEYKKFCEANSLDYLEATFRNYRQFFLSHHIRIEVVENSGQFEGVITPFILDVEEIRCDLSEYKRDAEYDVVYQAFLLLDDLKQNHDL